MLDIFDKNALPKPDGNVIRNPQRIYNSADEIEKYHRL